MSVREAVVAPTSSGSCDLSQRPTWSPRQRTLMIAIVLLGALLRLIFFAVDRPLWIDEAMLAVNLVERDYSALGKPLDYGQVAPIGYLYVERFLLESFGNTEKVLRIPSLVAGLLTLPLFMVVARRVLTPSGAVLAMLLFSLSEPMIYYSVELKPYNVDVLTALLLFWLTLRIMQENWRAIDLILFGVVACVGLLFSYTLVFMVAVLGAGLFVKAWTQKKQRHAIIVAMLCVFSAVVFLLLKKYFMEEGEAVHHHRGFWTQKRAFMPLPPRSLDDLTWFVIKPMEFFVDPMRYRAFGLAALLTLAGAWAMWRRDRILVLMMASPVVMIAFLSATKMYPFGVQGELRHPILGRVLLFVVPLILIIMARGLQLMRDRGGKAGSGAVAVVLVILFVHPLLMVVRYVRNPDEPHDIRPALKLIKEQIQPGDRVFVNWAGMMVSNYYWPKFGLEATPRFGVTGENGGALYIDVSRFEEYERTFAAQPAGRVWVMFVHSPDLPGHRTDDKWLRWYLPSLGQRLDVKGIDGKSAAAVEIDHVAFHLYKLAPPAERKR